MEFWVLVSLAVLGIAIWYRERIYGEWREARSNPRAWLKKMWRLYLVVTELMSSLEGTVVTGFPDYFGMFRGYRLV